MRPRARIDALRRRGCLRALVSRGTAAASPDPATGRGSACAGTRSARPLARRSSRDGRVPTSARAQTQEARR